MKNKLEGIDCFIPEDKVIEGTEVFTVSLDRSPEGTYNVVWEKFTIKQIGMTINDETDKYNVLLERDLSGVSEKDSVGIRTLRAKISSGYCIKETKKDLLVQFKSEFEKMLSAFDKYKL